MKVAALDLGTNTFLMLIAEVEDKGVRRVICDETRLVRLGQGLQKSNSFHPEALARARKALADFREIFQRQKVERVFAVATSAARDVDNGHELLEMGREFNIPIRIIEGGLEAELTFRGTTYDYKNIEGFGVLDIGGGSTELISQLKNRSTNQDRPIFGQSLNIGTVRLTERFITSHPIAPKEIKEVRDFVAKQLKELDLKKWNITQLLAVAGTPTNLASINMGKPYTADEIEGYVLSLEKIDYWCEKLSSMSVEARQNLAGLEPQRADVLPVGCVLLSESCKYLGLDRVIVSTRGVRYGVALYCAEAAS